MKELLAYYNSLTDPTVKWDLQHLCRNFFDPDEPDGYKKSIMKKSREELLNKGSNYSYDRQFWTLAYAFTYMTYNEIKDMLYDKNNDLTRCFSNTLTGDANQQKLLMLNSDDYRDLTYKILLDDHYENERKTDEYMSGRLEYLLLYNKDFSEQGRQKMFDTLYARYQSGEACNAFNEKALCFELFGEKNMKLIWKENAEYIRFTDNLFEKHIDLFDELFFCENGWNDTQKANFINNASYGMESFKKFVKYILSVDMSYIKNLPSMLRHDTAMINALASELKPDDEITEGMTYPQKYRYPKKFRNLLKVLYICIKEKCYKTRANQLKEIASIAKLYSYDFSLVCEAMYPEAFSTI